MPSPGFPWVDELATTSYTRFARHEETPQTALGPIPGPRGGPGEVI